MKTYSTSIRGQDRRQVRSHAAGPAADLEHAQPPPLGQIFHQHAQCVLSQKVVEPPDESILVELFGVAQRPGGED